MMRLDFTRKILAPYRRLSIVQYLQKRSRVEPIQRFDNYWICRKKSKRLRVVFADILPLQVLPLPQSHNLVSPRDIIEKPVLGQG